MRQIKAGISFLYFTNELSEVGGITFYNNTISDSYIDSFLYSSTCFLNMSQTKLINVQNTGNDKPLPFMQIDGGKQYFIDHFQLINTTIDDIIMLYFLNNAQVSLNYVEIMDSNFSNVNMIQA